MATVYVSDLLLSTSYRTSEMKDIGCDFRESKKILNFKELLQDGAANDRYFTFNKCRIIIKTRVGLRMLRDPTSQSLPMILD